MTKTKTYVSVKDIVKEGVVKYFCKRSSFYRSQFTFVRFCCPTIVGITANELSFILDYNDTNGLGLYDDYICDICIDNEWGKVINTEIYKQFTSNRDIIKMWTDILRLKVDYIDLIAEAIHNPEKYAQTYRYLLDLVIPDQSNTSSEMIKLLRNSHLWPAFIILNNIEPYINDYVNYLSFAKISETLQNDPNVLKFYTELYDNMRQLYRLAEEYSTDHRLFRLLQLQTW